MDHIREHRSLLASAEKRLLDRDRQAPAALAHLGSPDAARAVLAAAPPALAFSAIPETPWGAPCLALALAANWFGDSLDGTVARVRAQQRPRYGYYVDHVIDLAGTAALLAGMGASGLMQPSIALAVLAAYLLVSAETYLATHTVGVFRLSFAGVGPTELRILIAAGGFYVAAHPWVEIAGAPRPAARRQRTRRRRRPCAGVRRLCHQERARAVSRGAPAMTPRWGRFLAIGLLGFLLQLGTLGWLTRRAGWPWLAATLVSVELAIVHNFLWHVRWTWRDRPDARLAGFVRFQLTNGMSSLAGNAALMTLFTGVLGMPPLPANALAVLVMSVGEFRDGRSVGVPCGAAGIGVCAAGAGRRVGTARGRTGGVGALRDGHRTATRPTRGCRARPRDGARDAIPASGESVHVPSGTISDWRGSVFIRGVTLDRLLQRLQHPGTPPPQDDVVSSRVIARGDDSLRVAIRLVRRAIVTVTYDTEHEMRFRRWSPRLATARSVATRIEEVGGSDHGFLWRLHSYWRYEQIDGGVRVELESLTLSRDVPSLVRPIAAPLVTRIARESIVRTLEAFRRFFNTENTKDDFGLDEALADFACRLESACPASARRS